MSHNAAPSSALSLHRQQMETRLRLRRRLLRIETDGSAARESTERQRQRTMRRPRSSPLRKPSGPKDAEEEADEDEDGGVDDDGDEPEDGGDEEEGEEEEEEENNDGDDEGLLALGDVAATATTKSKSDKCDQSAVVKVLFSRADPRGRVPTVWFDYPPHLQVTREPPSSALGTASRLVAVNAAECALLFKTHWERNCVKNAFAVAGLGRTRKKWNAWHIAWAKHMPRDKFKLLKENQVFGHFPDPWVIGRKDRLMKTLTAHKRRFGSSYAFYPEGFTLPDHLDAFKRATGGSPTSLWILKPPAAACGRGIRVVPAREVDAFLTSKQGQERKYVAQKYLANPLLVDGFKFDLRIYVLVTSVDPLFIYMFEEGLTRFCTTPYSLANTRNRFAHLTNYSVNKTNKLFVENSNADSANTGNKWSMSALLAHLHTKGVVKDVVALRRQIQDVICKTVIAAEAHLTPLMHQFVKGFRPQNIKCFELFGFDLMLDDTCKPWLIEANVSPSLMAGSPLDRKVKGLLLSDIFHLVGVPVPRTKLPAGAIPCEFDPTVEEENNNRSAPPATRATTINKQLHEIVLDPMKSIFEKKDLDLFTANDWRIIHDMEDEMERLGHFERIFPCETAKETANYAQYFTCTRYSNALCAKWIETKNRARGKAVTVVGKQAAGRGSTNAAVSVKRSNSFGGSTRVTGKSVIGTNSIAAATSTARCLVVQTASR